LTKLYTRSVRSIYLYSDYILRASETFPGTLSYINPTSSHNTDSCCDCFLVGWLPPTGAVLRRMWRYLRQQTRGPEYTLLGTPELDTFEGLVVRCNAEDVPATAFFSEIYARIRTKTAAFRRGENRWQRVENFARAYEEELREKLTEYGYRNYGELRDWVTRHDI